MFQTGKKNVQRKSGMTTEQFFFSFFLVFCHLSVGHLKRVKFFIFFPSLFDCRLVFFFLGVQSKGRAHCPYSRSLAVRDQHG